MFINVQCIYFVDIIVHLVFLNNIKEGFLNSAELSHLNYTFGLTGLAWVDLKN